MAEDTPATTAQSSNDTASNSIFIHGLALAGYRSFGPSLQLIGPFGKVNLFVGANNSGKSNILRFIHKHYECVFSSIGTQEVTGQFADVDRHTGAGTGEFQFGIARPADHPFYETIVPANSAGRPVLEEILAHPVVGRGTSCAWFCYKAPTLGGKLEFVTPQSFIDIRDRLDEGRWQSLFHALHFDAQGGRFPLRITMILERLSPRQEPVPPVSLVPAIRHINAEHHEEGELNGSNIIKQLAELQNPTLEHRDKTRDFKNINKFLKAVTNKKDAQLEITHDAKTILVHMDQKTLPLDSLGMGIHEVVMLAAAATVRQKQILCIEEPELHAHPVLQRKLLQYLATRTTNQYFVSTHSAHLTEAPDVSVFHVRLVDGASVVTPAVSGSEKFEICRDLGYRASDLLQANCVIWVEGPADRVYLNHWIQTMRPGLAEGIDYSIMFYGGRLLRHLKVTDEEIEEFISLRRLNRHLVVVMDSDRGKSGAPINSTKRRVKGEFTDGDGFAWVTKGREIENYIDSSIMRLAVENVQPKLARYVKAGNFADILPNTNPKQKSIYFDKVRIAREVVKQEAEGGNVGFQMMDLRQKLEELVQFIDRANGR